MEVWPIPPCIIIDYLYRTRINYDTYFAWQALYFKRYEADTYFSIYN